MGHKIITGDSREVLQEDDLASFDLVVTSPPYGVGRGYDSHDDAEGGGWLDLITDVLALSWGRLNDGGRMAVVVQHGAGRSPYRPIGTHIEAIVTGLPESIYRGAIVWVQNPPNTAAWGPYRSPVAPVLRGSFEIIYVFSKGRLSRDDLNGDVRDPTPKALVDLARKAKSSRTRAERKWWSEIRRAEAWTDRHSMWPSTESDHEHARRVGRWEDWTRDVWFGPAVQPNGSGHPAAFPTWLAERLIRLYSAPGDRVLDPFAGTGTTSVAASRASLDYEEEWESVGIEISEGYSELARKRLSEIRSRDILRVAPGTTLMAEKSMEKNARRRAGRQGLRLSRIGVRTSDSPLAGTWLLYQDDDPVAHFQSLNDVEEWLRLYADRFTSLSQREVRRT